MCVSMWCAYIPACMCVCSSVWEHTCLQVGTHISERVPGGHRMVLDAFFDCFLLHLWKRGLQLNPEPIDRDTPASPPLVSPIFTRYPSSGIICRLSLLSGFLVSAGDPNTSRHACSTSAVSPKPWHQPLVVLYPHYHDCVHKGASPSVKVQVLCR